MTFLKRLRQAEAKMTRLAKTAAVFTSICGSDVTGTPPAQLNEARPTAGTNCGEKAYHHCLDLDFIFEDAETDLGSHSATSATFMWQCAWVERWVPHSRHWP